MKKHILVLFVVVIFCTHILSSVFTSNIMGCNININSEKNGWDQTYGGSSYDEGYSVYQTSDDGYIVTGGTSSFGAGNWDVWLIKTDSNGIEEWNNTFGDINYDKGSSVQQTNDEGYIIGGCTNSYSVGEFDFWLIKTDLNGNEEWNKTFGGIDVDWGTSVQQTSDGGYIIAGYTQSYGAGEFDYWLIKTDSNGNEEWNSTFGGVFHDRCFAVDQTDDDGYILTGYTVSYDEDNSGCDVWLVKTDTYGNKEWDTTFGGTGIANKFDIGYSVQQTSDGGYIISGDTEIYFVSSADFIVIKADSNGNEEWTNTYGGDGTDRGRSVQQTLNGGFITTGWSASFGSGYPDIWLLKINPDGYEEWDINYGFGENSSDWGYSVQQTNDEGYIIAGATMFGGWMNIETNNMKNEEGTDVWLIKIDQIENEPPQTPDKPNGPNDGIVGEMYYFTTSTIDPENNLISYLFDWGDGNFSDWTEFIPSGDEINLSYSWSEKGIYDVKVKAKDSHGDESPSWSQPHTISIEESSLDIKSIKGGLGVSAVIKNDCDCDIYNVKWQIFVKGGILDHIDFEKNETIAELKTNEESTIRTGLIGLFRLGSIHVTISVEADDVGRITKEANGFIIGPFVLILD